MKIDKPENANYCATVVRIHNTFPLENCDNIVATNIFGFQTLLGKDTATIGVFFPAEAQLSDQYCYENNLFRHGNLNKNPDEKGYIEDNRRVRAIKFRGNISNGFFMPLESLSWTGIDVNNLKEGDEFDTLNGKEVCRKYVVKQKNQREQKVVDRGFVRADKKFMPEHIDTENFFKNHDKIDLKTKVIVTQKLHGTSIRIAHTYVNRKQSFLERISNYLGAKIQNTEYAYLYGSRKVIKDANNPDQNHYYETDIWTNEGKKLDGLLPENYLVFAELIGWTPDGKPLQKDYTYGLPVGTCEMYIYRIAIINEKGYTTDLSWEQVKEFCSKNGLKYVPEIGVRTMETLISQDFSLIKQLLDTRFHDVLELEGTLWLGDDKELVDEGVCVRADGLTPKILKAKSPKFLQHETAILDEGVEDLESTQS